MIEFNTEFPGTGKYLLTHVIGDSKYVTVTRNDKIINHSGKKSDIIISVSVNIISYCNVSILLSN